MTTEQNPTPPEQPVSDAAREAAEAAVNAIENTLRDWLVCGDDRPNAIAAVAPHFQRAIDAATAELRERAENAEGEVILKGAACAALRDKLAAKDREIAELNAGTHLLFSQRELPKVIAERDQLRGDLDKQLVWGNQIEAEVAQLRAQLAEAQQNLAGASANSRRNGELADSLSVQLRESEAKLAEANKNWEDEIEEVELERRLRDKWFARVETAEQQLATQTAKMRDSELACQEKLDTLGTWNAELTAHVAALREAVQIALGSLCSAAISDGVHTMLQDTLAATAPKGDAKPAKFQSLADQRDESQKIQRQAYKLLNGEPK